MIYIIQRSNTFAKDTTRGSKTYVSFVKTRASAKKFDTEAAAKAYIEMNSLTGVAVVAIAGKAQASSAATTSGETPQRRATDGGENIRIWGWFDEPSANVEHEGVKSPPRVTVTSDRGLTFTEAWGRVRKTVRCNDPFPFSHILLTGADAAAYRADPTNEFPVQDI